MKTTDRFVEIGGPISATKTSLRFWGDDLDPNAISALLGASPTSSATKGEVWVDNRGVKRTERTSRWLLQAARSRPGDLDSQLVELLSPLTQDIAVWRSLVARFKADIFCGLFMEEGNEGFELRPETLAMIGARGLSLGFDIYGPTSDEGDDAKGDAI